MKKTFLYGVMAVGLLFTACKSDEPLNQDDQQPSVAQRDKTMYVSLNIHGDAAVSRASEDNGNPDADVTGDFDLGTGESEVQNAYFVFYDEDGNLVGEIINVKLSNEKTETTGPSVEKYYQEVVPVTIYKGEKTPAQVICYINPISPNSLQNNLNMIQTVTRDEIYKNSQDGTKKYFAMSNSVYYPGEGDPQIAVPVSAAQLHDTEQEAKDALAGGKNIVEIYVERYASKLKFVTGRTDDENFNKPYVTATSMINDDSEIPVTLTFVPKRWALNAACQESYVVKSFRHESADGSILPANYTYGELNLAINPKVLGGPELLTTGLWSWNNSGYHRSYWGMSPAYFTSEYPEVSSDVDVPQQDNNLHQYYYTYNDLTSSSPKGYAPDNKDYHYFHETTVGTNALLSKNPAAAVPSVIYVGDYTIAVNGTTLEDGTTFYTYLRGSNGNPLVFFEAAEDGTSKVEGAESMLRRFIEQTSILFKFINGEYVPYGTSDEDLAKLIPLLEVTVPSDDVKGDMKIAERYRTLQFKESALDDNKLADVYVADGDGYKSIVKTVTDKDTQIDLNQANKDLMQQLGFCVKYELSSGYFNIPVKHLGWYREANTQKNEEGKIDWNLVRVGDFGMVRNHSYYIDVTKIVGLATGIGGHDNPIVPPADTEESYVAYRVNILKWAVVPTQHVNL